MGVIYQHRRWLKELKLSVQVELKYLMRMAFAVQEETLEK